MYIYIYIYIYINDAFAAEAAAARLLIALYYGVPQAITTRQSPVIRRPVCTCPSQELPDPTLVLVLAGCKRDLCTRQRQVTAKQGKLLCAEFGMSFFEVSALDGTNVDALFRTVATRIDTARTRPLSAHAVQLGDGGVQEPHRGCGC